MASRVAIPFSMHCSICYEAFDSIERPPVVLPCGHTYLCSPCSKRLKTCMECRTPLFTLRPKSPVTASSYRHTAPSRLSPTGGARNRSPVNVPTKTESVPLPIPKNLVLMSLLEASRRIVPSAEENEKDYESGDDDEQVLAGMRLVASDYGTYVVKELNGLVVRAQVPDVSFPLHHEGAIAGGEEKSPLNDDKENCNGDVMYLSTSFSSHDDSSGIEVQSKTAACRSSGLALSPSEDQNLNLENTPQTPSLPFPPLERNDSLRLSYGQTVQVVSFKDGIAKLARNRGYLCATESQLVKIGDPMDAACAYEGMLLNVTSQKEPLLRKLAELEKAESELSQSLQEALQVEDKDPFAMAPVADYEVDSRPTTPPPISKVNLSDSSSETPPIRNASPGQTVMSLPPDIDMAPLESHDFENFVLSVTAAAREQDERLENSLGGGDRCTLPTLACTDMLPAFFGDDEWDEMRLSARHQVSHAAAAAAAESSPDRESPGVNFRTGLSGHMALSSASTHADRRVLDHTPKRKNLRLMSQTYGIAHIRRMRKADAGSSSPKLSNPTW